jgi:hypothetical protein
MGEPPLRRRNASQVDRAGTPKKCVPGASEGLKCYPAQWAHTLHSYYVGNSPLRASLTLLAPQAHRAPNPMTTDRTRFAPLAFTLLSLTAAPALAASLAPWLAPQSPVELAQQVAQQEDLGWVVTLRGVEGVPAQTMRSLARMRGEYTIARGQGRTTDELAPIGDHFRSAADAAAKRLHEASADFRAFVESRDAKVGGELWLTGSVHISGASEELLAELRQRPDVARIDENVRRSPQLLQATDALHHDSVGAHTLLAAGIPVTGVGVGIAVLDSGLDMDMNGTGFPHRTFYVNGNPMDLSGGGIGGSRILSSYGANGSGMFYTVTNEEDIHGHGTRMGSMIAGRKHNGISNVADGIAPDADLHNFKISDDSFIGAQATTLAMAYSLAEAWKTPGVRVANLSYDGHDDVDYFLNRIIDSVSNSGMLVTVSAGNFGANISFAHAAPNALVSGGSFEAIRQPYTTSAIGPLTTGHRYPDMLSQGEVITCARLDNEQSYYVSTGSSGASALTAGAAALVIQADPTLIPSEVKSLLLNTTWDLQGGNPNAGGLGYMRAKEAVQDALAGLVESGLVAAGHSVTYTRGLTASEAASFTLVWERPGTPTLFSGVTKTIGELDLKVLDPNGAVLFASLDTVNNEEQYRFTAATAGNYSIVVEGVTDAGGTPYTYFSLAGVNGNGVGDTGCITGPPSIATVTPSMFAPITPAGLDPIVTIDGCNCFSFTGASLGGQALSMDIISGTKVEVSAIPNDLLGAQVIDLTYAGGTIQVPINLIPVASPQLVAPSIGISLTGFSFDMFSGPGDIAVLVVSPDLAPSVLPGIYAMDIGAANSSLTILGLATVPVGSGKATFVVPPLPQTLPPFTFYSQFLNIGAGGLTLPLTASNSDSTQVFL